ncbi:unnamed protein product (macronuclear) [Paramecium tetraurelia]|uniref:Uncharacterized protein n=1 Tax=Paramecium tetraurelia TaxID=5888 RepID=A0BHK6_PARTE|nr:uncharacterized protein GSPATT00029058001 [Paramecium tetraurelia]CAK58023.1 unnamed protein product [Paramecium tetraurelia]|eukprot:XP_001425421.1 hypothetical protein (macronuclear) [Paramecium tetraurelia strain d4-2]
MYQNDEDRLPELQREIQECLDALEHIGKTPYPYPHSILQLYQDLNKSLKKLFIKSAKLKEQSIVPNSQATLKYCDGSLELQSIIYNNEVQQVCKLSHKDIEKKQLNLKSMYSFAKEHPYLDDKKKKRRR